MADSPKVTGFELSSDPSERVLRVCVIGARRVRNGTGPFLARQVADAGAELVGVLGTTPATAEAARAALAEDGYPCQAFTSFEHMVTETQPTALVIATPAGTHRPWLESALQHDLHVLCEKPLLTVYNDDAASLPARFAAHGRVLMENCQWPETLDAFGALHPSCAADHITRFRMMLAPEFRGLSRWIETLSHPLSLLQTVASGPAEVENVRFAEAGPAAPDARLSFRYQTLDRAIECEIRMQDTGEWPRPAEFALDDFVARRVVEQPDYQFFFDDGYRPEGEGEARRVSADDPQVRLVEKFIAAVQEAQHSGEAPANEDIARRQRLLATLLAAYSSGART
ncbi:MAG: Gfo/Idh/MocA family oxidoreductase [Planctomycetes bacterium]|nr:Gfo/Idh/MocA family oxidoreductase [Planctomycetota bacterium]